MPGGYELSYAGKEPEAGVLGRSAGGYVELQDPVLLGTGTGNRLAWAENLDYLLSLTTDPDVTGKVRTVYIDPPYSTDGVFRTLDMQEAYEDTLTGAEYVEFIRKRLIVLRELLADDGSIYVHLDSNMVFEVKLVMDELFGRRNFRNMITRQKCSTKNGATRRFGNVSDYILFYSKSSNYVWNRVYDPWDPGRAEREYPCVEEGTGRRFKKVPVHAPGVRNGETGQLWRGKMPPEGKHWQMPPRELDRLDAEGRIYWSPTGNPRKKVYLDESPGVPRQDIWLGRRDSINQCVKGTGYPTEKNFSLLEDIVLASSDPGDLVLDAFCGSGTSLEAAHRNGRRWIGVDSGIEAIMCCVKRFSTGVEAMGDYVKTGRAVMTRDHQDLASLESPLPFGIVTIAEAEKSAREQLGLTRGKIAG